MIRISQTGAKPAFSAGVAVAALLAGTSAWAAEGVEGASGSVDNAETGPEEIVVTARRREERAQEVPVSLSVVGADTLERTGVYTIDQVQRLVPSLQVLALNPRNSTINIRGLGSNSAVALDGLEPGFGFYVDGVYYARPGQSQFDLVDLERIEVLKGPQGTLFGKNTAAGAINITTRSPSFDPELMAEGTVGNYGHHQFRFSGSVPLIADKVAFRLSVADTHRDGYLTNLAGGSGYQGYDSFSVRGQLLIKPSDALSIRIIGDYSKQRQRSVGVIENYFSTYANGATIANNIYDRAARTGYTLVPARPFDRIIDIDAPVQHDQEGYGVSGEVNWDIGPATLTSITAYRWWDWYPYNDIDNTSLDVQGSGLNSFQRQFSQELRLASNGRNTIDYQVGLYYFWQKVPGFGRTVYGADWAAFNLASSTPAATRAIYDLALNGFVANFQSNPRTKSYAVFGQVDWHITDALTLTAGLRYTHERKEGEFSQVWASGLDISTLPTADQVIANTARAASPQVAFSARGKHNAVSGLATLSYELAPDILVYGTYAHGGKSGGLNLTAAGITNPVVRAEKVDSFEVGIKSQLLDRKLTLNAAAFHTNVRDYQAAILEQIGTSVSTRSYISNIPKVRSRGFEADVNFALNDWLNLSASAAYTDARYVVYTNAPQKTELSLPGTLPIQDLSGTRVPAIPKFAYNLSIDASRRLGAGDGAGSVYGRVDFSHRSSTNVSNNNSKYGFIAGYGLVNARLGFRTVNERLDASLWVRNLTDKGYYVSRGAQAYGVITSTLGEPRTYGLTIRTKW